MLRKPGFPVANCSIKMPDSSSLAEAVVYEDDNEQQQRRQHLINFGHSQWGFNNWNWSVTKQELDFVDFSNGKYCAGVVAFVSVTVKSFDIHRENIGYATSVATNKGLAIYKSRKVAVTNALRETLLSFGGTVATELLELLETHKGEFTAATPADQQENNQIIPNKQEPRNYMRKESEGSPANSVKIMNPPGAVPVAKAHPMPVNLPPAANRPPLVGASGAGQRPPPPTPVPPVAPRPGSNVSFVLQPVVGAPPALFAPPRLAPPAPPAPPPPPAHLFPNYYNYEYSAGPWHFTYEPYDRHHGNVNLNFNIPPKNLVMNGRAECRNSGAEGEPLHYGPPQPAQGCWIKPTIFYDGFWTEQKVKKWVAEQVEKQFPEDARRPASPAAAHDGPAHK